MIPVDRFTKGVVAVLKSGKLPPKLLDKLILVHLGSLREEVLVHSKAGEDCSVIDCGDNVCILSTDPITGSLRDIGMLAVHISCNDVAANGGEPLGIMVDLLLPVGTVKEEVGKIMNDIGQTAHELGIEVLGGHTEVTPVVNRPLVCTMAVGLAPKGRFVTSSGANVGDAVIMSKHCAIEGTAILASECEEKLRSLVGADTVNRAKGFFDKISVVPEGLAARDAGATSMHDATEGGILGALFELASASNVGLDIDLQSIPVAEETTKICQVFGISPLKLISSGSMLITAPDGEKVLRALGENGIPATIIGAVCEKSQGFSFEPPQTDELWKVMKE